MLHGVDLSCYPSPGRVFLLPTWWGGASTLRLPPQIKGLPEDRLRAYEWEACFSPTGLSRSLGTEGKMSSLVPDPYLTLGPAGWVFMDFDEEHELPESQVLHELCGSGN